MTFGIRAKLTLLVAVSLVAAMAAVAVVVGSRVRDHLVEETLRHARALAETLAGNSIEAAASGDELNLALYVDEIRAREAIAYALVTDANGRILAHSDRSVVRGVVWTDAATVRSLSARDVVTQPVATAQGVVTDVACPVQKGKAKVIARIGVTQERVDAVVRRVRRTVLGATALVLALALGGALVATRQVTQPVSALADGARRLGEGDLSHRVHASSRDELGVLATTFNEMAAHISDARAALERRVEAANRNLLERNQQMDASFASIRDGVVVTDAAGEVFVMNDAARTALGVPRGAVGRLADVAGAGALSDALAEGLARAAAGEAHRCEVTRVHGGGRRNWYRVTSDPVRDPAGALLGAVTVLHDVTLDKELDEMKSEFISHVSHELRTPLTALQGAVSLLAKGAGGRPTAKSKRFLAIAQANGDHLMRLIADLLEIARFEAGKSIFRFGETALSRVAQDAVDRVYPVAQAKKLSLTAKIDERVPAVRADEEKLRQLLNNLLSNAIKYTPPGGRVALAVSAGGGRSPQEVRIEVSDTGVGIAAEEREKVFEKFHRVENPLSGAGGVGLGLPIARYIAEGHGGRIWVESELGKGSTFHVRLPVAGPAAASGGGAVGA